MSTLADTPLATDFPCLQREGIVYMDSAATSQTPQPVIDAMADYYEHHRGTVHRSVYALAAEATELFEGARDRIAAFMNWPADCTIFTKNATEALNLVAYSWGRANVGPGDTRRRRPSSSTTRTSCPGTCSAARPARSSRWSRSTTSARSTSTQLDALLATGTVKLVAVGHVSNAAGTINPVAEIVERAHAAGAVVVVDGSQAVPQMPVDLAELDADFYAWTGHKLYGPTGIGVLHGRKELLDAMPPFLGGGHMIASVSVDEIRWGQLPAKFEAGTSNIAEAIGLGAAVDFVSAIGMESIREHERDLCAYALDRLGRAARRHGHGSAGRRPARRARRVHAGHRPPARHRRDPRLQRRLRARRPSLRPAAHAALRRRGDDAGVVRRAQHPRRRRRARSTGSTTYARSSDDRPRTHQEAR